MCKYCDIMHNMNKTEAIKELLDTKRKEIIWALSLQDYTHEDIAEILRGADRSTVTRIINQRPVDWNPKWVKRS